MFVRRGRTDDPQPLSHDSSVVKMKGCPDCEGRGWFLINPFATGGTNGCGGISNMCQCMTCKDAEAYFKENGDLPEEIKTLLATK